MTGIISNIIEWVYSLLQQPESHQFSLKSIFDIGPDPKIGIQIHLGRPMYSLISGKECKAAETPIRGLWHQIFRFKPCNIYC